MLAYRIHQKFVIDFRNVETKLFLKTNICERDVRSLIIFHSFIHSFLSNPTSFPRLLPNHPLTIFPGQCQILMKNNNNNKQTNLYYLKTPSRNHYKKTFRTSRKFSDSSYHWRPSSLLLDNLVLLVSWKMLIRLYLNHRFSFFIFHYPNLCMIFIWESDAYT